jgi:4-hydroxy-3-polyprenylbenzoate decarboxylase
MQHLKSLREYISALQTIGEVQQIDKGVDLDYEIGAISRRSYETGAPAPQFNNINGICGGFRVLGAPAGVSNQPGLYLSRIAVSLGLDPKSSGRQIIDELVAARDRAPIKPKVVTKAPCKQNIHLGADVNLHELPAPWLHDGDGGRFLNTYGIIVAQSPDKSWTNWSIARIMIVDKTHMAGIVAPFQHIGMIHKMWADIGKDMPFALALGVEPFLPFAGGMPLPAHFDEADYVGGYFGEAIEVTPAETVDLMVPATAEIVVEGHLSATEKLPEGPMGEYAGYLWNSGPFPKPMYTVTAITHQDDAILPVSVAGEPPEENHTAWGVPNAAEIVYELRKEGIPVATAWSPFESANHWYVIALDLDWQPKTGLTGEHICRRIGDKLFKSKAGLGTPKYLVVNDDVDITNLKEVVWAFAMRNYPGERGELTFHGETTNPLVSFLHDDEKMSMQTTKVVYNCLPPEEWHGSLPKRSSFYGAFSPAMQAKVLENWTAYGYKPILEAQ